MLGKKGPGELPPALLFSEHIMDTGLSILREPGRKNPLSLFHTSCMPRKDQKIDLLTYIYYSVDYSARIH
jgi:hypothetical protein